jgi:hypothetical protein
MTTKELQARHVHAGDELVIRVGERRHSYHVSEAGRLGSRVTLIYDTDTGRVPLDVDARDPVRVRTDVERLRPGQTRR